jgi:hypothetical protein
VVVSCEAVASADSGVCPAVSAVAAAGAEAFGAGADASFAGAVGVAGGEERPHAVMLIRLSAIATDSRNIVVLAFKYQRIPCT